MPAGTPGKADNFFGINPKNMEKKVGRPRKQAGKQKEGALRTVKIFDEVGAIIKQLNPDESGVGSSNDTKSQDMSTDEGHLDRSVPQVPSVPESLFRRCVGMIEAGIDPETPEFLDLYGQLSPEKRALVDQARRMMLRLQPIEDDAREAAAEIREAVAPGGHPQPQQIWAPCAPMPTEMCRVSPFFPVRQRDMKDRLYIRNMVITSNNWGEITYTGPKLSTYEEDVLLAVLALLDNNKNRQSEQVDGRSTYTYQGPLLPVLRLMGYQKAAYGGSDYKRILDALKLLMGAVIEMRIYEKSTRKKRKVKRVTMTNLLTYANWDDTQKVLQITINPYFYEAYVARTVTLIDVLERAKLKSPIAKCLMKFMQSHRAQKWGPAHYLTLARTLNLDLDQPPFQIRRLLKGAICELLETGWLSAGGYESRDLVTLTRATEASTRRRLKS